MRNLGVSRSSSYSLSSASAVCLDAHANRQAWLMISAMLKMVALVPSDVLDGTAYCFCLIHWCLAMNSCIVWLSMCRAELVISCSMWQQMWGWSVLHPLLASSSLAKCTKRHIMNHASLWVPSTILLYERDKWVPYTVCITYNAGNQWPSILTSNSSRSTKFNLLRSQHRPCAKQHKFKPGFSNRAFSSILSTRV